MKKYLLLFQQTFSQFSSYRLQIIFRIVQNFIPPLLIVAALTRTVGNAQLISSLLPYYILIALISPLTLSSIDSDLDDLTNSGDINNFLLKPYSLFKWLLVREFSEKNLVFILLFPVFIFIAFFYHLSLINLINLITASLLSFILSFTFSYSVGLLCFWIEDFWAIHNLKFVVVQFLAGAVLPYSLFPASVAAVLKYSFFPYLINWPVRVIQHSSDLADFILAVAWIIIMFILTAYLQKKAILKYSYTNS
jgi:ABC-2 type transport system permease protein